MNVLQIVLFVIGVVLTVFFARFFFASGKEYRDYIVRINRKGNALAELYYIGFRFMEWIGYDLRSIKNKKRMTELVEVVDKNYVEFYLYVLRGGQFTILLLGLPVSFLSGAIANSILLTVLLLFATAFCMYVKEDNYNDIRKKKKQKMLLEFPNIVSKLTLLVNSGMVLRDAWSRVGNASDGPLYTEMQKTVEELENGVMEIQAYKNFAERCNDRTIRKFTSTVIQNLQIGGDKLSEYLKDLSGELWLEKKAHIKKLGDAANSKLMIPMFLIFIGIMIMVIAPMISSISF